MSGERIKRKVVWEKSGVSEIIGTILMLSITVVLFSGIITMVGSLPAPKQSFVVDLKCSLQPVNPDNWTHGVNFIILHQGGQVMDDLWIVIYLSVDNINLVPMKVSDGLEDRNNDTSWGVGEQWKFLVNISVAHDLSKASKFSVTIVDQQKNALVWQEILRFEENQYSPVIVRTWTDSDIYTPGDESGPIPLTKPFVILAEIIDPLGDLNPDSIFVNMSTMYGTGSQPIQLFDVDTYEANPGIISLYGHHHDNIYLKVCEPPGHDTIPGYYRFYFNASNSFQNTSEMYVFPVGETLGVPKVSVENIMFSNDKPTNGDTVKLTSNIWNRGITTEVNVTFSVSKENTTTFYGWILTSMAMGEQKDVSINWLAKPGGEHLVMVNVTPLAGSNHDDAVDSMNKTIVVMPKILLVDDDDRTDHGDTALLMRASLEIADFSYEYTMFKPTYNGTSDEDKYALKKYDIVIWMTGYRENPITSTDIAELELYMNTGGNVWLISQGFWEQVGSEPYTDFAINYLGSHNFYTGTGPLPSLLGNADNPVTEYFSNYTIETKGDSGVHYWFTDSIGPERDALVNDDKTKAYAMTYNHTNSRRLSQTFEFTRISDTSVQAQYCYKAIMWLGSIDYKFSEDLAISSLTYYPSLIFFRQPVTISFNVRNNGFETYNYTEVRYAIEIRNETSSVASFGNGTDKAIDPSTEFVPALGIGNNNTAIVNLTWIPYSLGEHRIWIMVYFNDTTVVERNLENNVISKYWGSDVLNVQYRVLVVDDDDSENNGGPPATTNETFHVLEAMKYLDERRNQTGLEKTYHYELYVVPLGKCGPAFMSEDPEATALNKYNAVIWVAGNASEPLLIKDGGNDFDNITQYLKIGNFWLLGTGIDNITDEFRSTQLRIFSVAANMGSGNTLNGVNNDPVAHGMEFPMANNANSDRLVPVAGAEGVTHNAGHYNAVRYAGMAGDLSFRVMTTSWLLSDLTGHAHSEQHRAEFVYMALRWFDKENNMKEPRITNSDIQILDGTGAPLEKPQIGSGYVIRAVVYNTGGTTANALVRFMDGRTQIGSTSLSVFPGERTTAEMIWVPLFAGLRNIQVLVDPISEVTEIFEWSNNNATKSIYVYFFWDDMESGTSKWSRGSSILHISGEGALDYFHETVLSTKVSSDWDANYSHMVNPITDIGFYHSYNSAYWLQETPGGNVSSVTRGTSQDALNGLPIGPAPKDTFTETRYMRGDTHTVNTLSAYQLGATQSATAQSITRTQLGGWSQLVTWGLRLWKRSSVGVETEITTGSMVATVSRSVNGAGLQNNTWACPDISLVTTDSIVIRVYDLIGAGTVTQRAEFTTAQLGALQLEASTLNIYYYTERTEGGTGGNKNTGSIFRWGTSTYNSRIEGFTYTTPDTTPPTVVSTTPANGATNVATDTTVRVTFDEPMKTTVTPLLVQTAGGGGGGWTLSSWESGDLTAIFTHSAWTPGDSITLELSGAEDVAGNVMVGTYTWSFTTSSGATATATGPSGNTISSIVTITYSYVGLPAYVLIYNSSDGGVTWQYTGNDTSVDGNFPWVLPSFGNYHWIAVAGLSENPPISGDPPEAGPCNYSDVRPEIIFRSPSSGATDVKLDEYIRISFSEAMNTATFSISITPNPGELVLSWNNGNRNVTVAHKNFPQNSPITVTIVNAQNPAGSSVVPTSWSFTTGEGVGGDIDWTMLGRTPDGTNYNKSAVTEPMDLSNLSSAKLSFWHKYNLLAGKNGGFLQMGYLEGGLWKWLYVTPANAYTGNLDSSKVLRDNTDDKNRISWCWNGISGQGTFGWDYVQMDLVSVLKLHPEIDPNQVRMKFNYTQWGNGTGYGWYIDDVSVTVTRQNDTAIAGDRDLWALTTATDRFGNGNNTAWWNRDPANPNMMAPGLDNYLMTQPIDLTNARNATLSAYLKFNINTADGAPPDGFRIEVSQDNGVTWEAINLGVRSAWNVSGILPAGPDGKSYSGVDAGNNWVNVNTLTRVTTDLSVFSGSVIHIRFRMVTCAHSLYEHNNDYLLNGYDPGFGGFYVDDVEVKGETILS